LALKRLECDCFWAITFIGILVLLQRSRLLLVRLLTMVLLVTIGVQANEPIRQIQPKAGSAFSAATADVAIVSARKENSANRLALPTSIVSYPVVAACIAAIIILTGTFLAPSTKRLVATGPPHRTLRRGQPVSPRDPPLILN